MGEMINVKSIRARQKSTLMKLKLYLTKFFNFFIVKFNPSIQHLVKFELTMHIIVN